MKRKKGAWYRVVCVWNPHFLCKASGGPVRGSLGQDMGHLRVVSRNEQREAVGGIRFLVAKARESQESQAGCMHAFGEHAEEKAGSCSLSRELTWQQQERQP